MLPLIILTGPTNSGKSDTALALARKLDTEIISADSLQVYKYFDIGTAKPSRAVREEVPHHLIDILEPEQEFNAFDFKTQALKVMSDLMQRDKIPILVGGTALYLKVLIEDYDCAEETPAEIRETIRQNICDRGIEYVYQELQRVDPEYAAKICETDAIRIERALGVYLDTGKPFSEFHQGDSPSLSRFPIHTFILEKERSELYSQINQRVDTMIEDGLENETQSILDRGYSPELKPLKSIGYAQMVQYIQDHITLERAVYEIKMKTRHYAKRQLTWFRKMNPAQTLTADTQDSPESLSEKLLACLPKVTACFLAIFLSFAQTSFAEDKTPYEKAKTLFQKKEWGKAKNSLLSLQNTSPKSKTSQRAQFLLALIHVEQGKHEEAIKLLSPLSKNFKEVEDYIQFQLIQAHAASGKYKTAKETALEFLQHHPNSLLYPKTQMVLAEAQIQLGEKEAGMKTLEELITAITKNISYQNFREFLPEIIFKLAEVQEKSEKKTEAYLNFRRLHFQYPNHEHTPDAELALKRLSALATVKSIPLTLREHTDRIQGLLKNVRYEEAIKEVKAIQKANNPTPGRFYFFLAQAHRGLRDRKQANVALKKFLKLYPHHAKAQNAKLNIGRNLWNLGQPMQGAKYFKAVTKDAPSSELAVKAQFFLGKIYEERKNYPKALATYKSAFEKYPEEYYAQWAGWRLGWIHYLDGKFEQSFNRFQEAARLFPSGSFIEYNLYWSAKSAEKLNQKEVARDLYARVFKFYPYTFHGIRAKDRLQVLGVKPTSEPKGKTLKNTSSGRPPQLGRPLSIEEKFHYVRADELAKLGLSQEARNEIGELQKLVKKNLTGVLWISHLYHQAQGYAESLRLLHLYKDFTTKSKEKNLSPEFWKHFFPLAYKEAVLAYAKSRKVDPSFVNSIIRQESLFDSQALSPAGARGLMQIMPATGEKLYPTSKMTKPFETDALFDPDLNIRLGVKYVSQLNKRFDRNGMHILISYNAGPHVLKKWLKRFQHLNDQDVFIESIPYPETRRYVKHVLRNFGIYKTLYSLS